MIYDAEVLAWQFLPWLFTLGWWNAGVDLALARAPRV